MGNQASWIRRADQEPEIKDDCSEEYLAWDGRRIGIIRHGYDDVWLIEDGIRFDFTHWMPMPAARNGKRPESMNALPAEKDSLGCL